MRLSRAIQALELMKTHVVKTTPEATLSEAVDLMDLYQASGLPVVDADGRLCGMLTESDVLRAVGQAAGQWGDGEMGKRIGAFLVREFMTAPAVSVAEDVDVAEAAETMLSRHLKRLPVVNDAGQVVGVLNRIDVFQAIFEGNL